MARPHDLGPEDPYRTNDLHRTNDFQWTSKRHRSGGRIDRADVLVMAAILLVALVSRGYRLDEPRAMYFDEVYHARTATEFLQDWRYSEPHDIYEWTHPHLAKYAMAVAIALLGNDRVVDTGDLDTPVTSALVQRPQVTADGERASTLWVAGHDGLTGLHGWPVPSRDVSRPIVGPVTAMALDPDSGLLYAATPTGVVEVDTATDNAAVVRTLFERPDIVDIALLGDSVATLSTDGEVQAWALNGSPIASIAIPGAVTIAAAAEMPLVVADTSQVTDPAAEAVALADLTGDDASDIEARLRTDSPFVVLSVAPDADTTQAISDAADDLAGIRVESRPLLAVGRSTPTSTGPAGDVRLLDAATLAEATELALSDPVADMVLVPSLDPPTLFVGGGDAVTTITVGSDGPSVSAPLTMPGAVTRLAWNESANLVHVATTTSAGEPTVGVIEPDGLTLFADAPLPFQPTALAVQDLPDIPDAAIRVVAIASDGRTAVIDGGSNAWAWRVPGVLAGALTVLCLYVLARILASRRSVALAVAGLALLDGMMFVTARIGMNDAYVVLAITAAVTVFASLWLGRWQRPWVVAMGLVGVGVLLGLALASKWVGLYAIGGVGLLLLARSGIGRLLILGSMVGATAVLGAAAIATGDVPDSAENWTFLVLMLGLTAAVGAAIVRRPLAFEPHELRGVGALGVVIGALLIGAGLVAAGSPLVLVGGLSLIVGIALIVVGRSSPMRSRTALNTDGTPTFLLPGRRGGVPWMFALGCLTVIPIGVYVLSYLPWVALGNQLVAGFPAGHHGQTLLELTRSMYEYHDQLRATHPASSPWWAWLLDLKPVWMYLGDMAGGLTGSIYDGDNPLILWSSIGGLVFTGMRAWRGRRPGDALVVIMFLALWLPWARIDRATFQYHLTGSLPFAVLALALLLSAMWHRGSPLALLTGRVTIVVMSFLPAAMWLLRGPLCGLSGVDDPALCTTGGSGIGTAVALGLLGALPASLAWHTHDGRRLIVGLVVVKTLVSVALYPSLSGLPVPDFIASWATTLLPTWDYGWQFAVNTEPAVERSLIGLDTFAIGMLAVGLTAVTMAVAARMAPHDRTSRDVSVV